MKDAWRSQGTGAALIILLTVVAYFPTLQCGFIWDDETYVTENQTLHSRDGLERIWVKPGATKQYYPLVFTSFWLEYHLWKLRPLGYHLVNVFLHGLNAVLLWRVLQRLNVPGAWWAAAIFALHPIQVESVAWVTERKNVLSTAFYFLALLAYLRFRPLTGEKATIAFDWRFYPLVSVLFLCALLSKTVTCSLPAVLALLVWWKAGRLEKRDALALAPLLVLGATLGSLTVWMEKHRVGASGAEWELSFVQRCLVAGRALWFYAGKLIWPHNLTFIYPRWKIDEGVWWQYLFPAAAVVVLIALWLLRQRIGRGPLVAALCFAGTLAPALGFIDVYPFRFSFVADHFQYLAGIGLIVLVASAGATACRRVGQPGQYLGTLVAAVVLTALGMSTWGQGHIYKDLETLWQDTLAKNPNAWIAHYNLGNLLAGQGKASEAIAEYTAALRIKPDHPKAHYNLGLTLWQAGKVQQATEHWDLALRINPNYVEAKNNLAWLLATLAPGEGGDPVRAVALAEQACDFTGNRVPACLDTLAAAYAAAGRFSDAITTAQKAIKLAGSAGQKQLVGEIEARLQLYRDGRPYRLRPAAVQNQSIDATNPHSP